MSEFDFNPNGSGDRISTNDGNEFWTEEEVKHVKELHSQFCDKGLIDIPLSGHALRSFANYTYPTCPHVSELENKD